MSGGFQTAVNTQPAPAVAGDFADSNPRVSVNAGPGGLVAGAAGVTVGRAAWLSSSLIDPDNAPIIVNNFGSGAIAGIVPRRQQGLITQYLADASMVIPQGFQLELISRGGLWVKNEGSTQAQYGQKAYADFATGKLSFAATNSPSSASFTGAIAANTFSVTGSISGNVMTVTAVGSGTIVPGAAISGTGVASGSSVVSQLSGTAGGIGTYAVTPSEQTVASTTISGTYGTLTASAVTGTIEVGGVVGGAGVSAGTTITALGTGTGGAGTYIVNLTQTVASEAMTSTTNTETAFYAVSSGAAGELVKVATHMSSLG
jgi:hypothetical protein